MCCVYSVSASQVPIKDQRAWKGIGNAGSSASRGSAGESDSARLARRGGWRRWWWPMPRWWSTTGRKMWRAMSSPS